MKRFWSMALLAAACVLVPGVAASQGACPEGRTADGQCVNADLAASLRQGAIIFSQPKLSMSHYPVMPSQDWLYRLPDQLNPNPLKPSPTGTPAIIVIP